MPNQPDPEKRLIGYRARAAIRDAVDEYARANGIPNRAEAMERLLILALEAQGIEVPAEDRGYLPDLRAAGKA